MSTIQDPAQVLADFAETAPGRLPQRVQDAIAAVRASLEASAPSNAKPFGWYVAYASGGGGRLVFERPSDHASQRVTPLYASPSPVTLNEGERKRVLADLASVEPWARSPSGRPECFFCGISQHTEHESECLWLRVRALTPEPDGALQERERLSLERITWAIAGVSSRAEWEKVRANAPNTAIWMLEAAARVAALTSPKSVAVQGEREPETLERAAYQGGDDRKEIDEEA